MSIGVCGVRDFRTHRTHLISESENPNWAHYNSNLWTTIFIIFFGCFGMGKYKGMTNFMGPWYQSCFGAITHEKIVYQWNMDLFYYFLHKISSFFQWTPPCLDRTGVHNQFFFMGFVWKQDPSIRRVQTIVFCIKKCNLGKSTIFWSKTSSHVYNRIYIYCI